MTPPCKGCKDRQVGCHNAEICKAWGEYEKAKKQSAARREEGNQSAYDWENHLRRRGRSHELTQR